MKAAIRRNYGLPNQIKIEEIDSPSPKENEVLIKVYATTVNRTDCANLTAKPFIMRFVLGLFKPNKVILGTDFAGEVIEIGKNVKSFKAGDRVFGFIDSGAESQAEFVTTCVKNVFPIPNNLDYTKAAASLEGAHYAYSFVHKVKISAGNHILINGASGGIGSALLQFVRQFDVQITATCDTKNMKRIESLGADKIIDYTQIDFTESGGKYDFVFDTVGKSTFGKCKPVLNQNGIYISSELGPYSQNIFLPVWTAISSKKVIFPIPFRTKETIPYISKTLASGKFHSIVDREYELKDISEAYDYVSQGKKTGNVVVNLVSN
jgi:NADPH:quinone reductase-like Zn-dependent oxidoreductase